MKTGVNLSTSISPHALEWLRTGKKRVDNGTPEEVYQRVAAVVDALDEGIDNIEEHTGIDFNKLPRKALIGTLIALLEDALWFKE